MTLQLAIYSKPDGGELLLDATPFVTQCSSSSNEHGPEAVQATVSRTLYDAFRVYNAPGTLHVVLSDGAGNVGVGRLEEPGLQSGSQNELTINALGYWRALSDLPYTAIWSSSALNEWTSITNLQLAAYRDEKYEFSTDDRLFIAPRKDERFGNSTLNYAAGGMTLTVPSQSSRLFVSARFSFVLIAPVGWVASFVAANDDFTGNTAVWSLNATGSVQSGAVTVTFSGKARLWFNLYLNTADATYTGETGATYLQVTDLRIFTTTTNRTVTGIISISGTTPGTATVTPVSMANIAVGTKIHQTSGAGGEIVTVTSTTTTTFTATYAQAHGTADTITAHVVYADEVLRDFVTAITSVNPMQLQSATSLIQSPGSDIGDASYDDADMSAIATQLATNVNYEVGVDAQRRLYFRPRGSQAQTWYIDADNVTLSRSLDGLRNSAYASYEDTSGATVRTATATDAASVQRYGVTRRQVVSAQTTDATFAGRVRDAALVDKANVQPRANYTISRIFGVNGATGRLCDVKAGDTLIVRNIPPAVSNALDTIRVFRTTRVEYDPIARSLTFEPEAPAPTLDALVGGTL